MNAFAYEFHQMKGVGSRQVKQIQKGIEGPLKEIPLHQF
jgi:hypothetical protein